MRNCRTSGADPIQRLPSNLKGVTPLLTLMSDSFPVFCMKFLEQIFPMLLRFQLQPVKDFVALRTIDRALVFDLGATLQQAFPYRAGSRQKRLPIIMREQRKDANSLTTATTQSDSPQRPIALNLR